jgi:hypothetical protein
MDDMNCLKRIFSCTVVVTVLAGCAGGVSQQEYRTPTEPIRTIGVLSISNPLSYHAMDFGSPGLAFGAVGGAVAGAGAASQTEAFDKVVKAEGFDYSKHLQAALVQRLKAAGFQVVAVSAKRVPGKPIEDYAAIRAAGVDAYLDLTPTWIGYATYNMFDRDFRPDVRVSVRLAAAKDGTALYSEQLMYGYKNPFMSATDLSAGKEHYYKSFEELMANKAKALTGIAASAEVIARHVAGRIRK